MVLLIVIGLVLVGLVAALFVFGAGLGMSSGLQLGLAALLLGPYLAFVFYRIYRARKAKQAAQPAAKVAQVAPEVKARLLAKRQKVGVALASSKTAGAQGPGLHRLPWVLMIGPTGAGKTSVLRRSRLEFQLTTLGEQKPEDPTVDVDWWFAKNGVVVDTAGRYGQREDGPDHDEWMFLLDLLRKAESPVESIFLCAPLPEILGTPEVAEALAGRLRRQLHETIQGLERLPPVYLVFTKSDYLFGFTQAFSNLAGADRAQPLGFLLPAEDPEAALPEAFDRLYVRLSEHLRTRLVSATAAERGKAYQLPAQLLAAQAPIERFLKSLLQPNSYGERSPVGGLYFTSAHQDGKTIDRVMADVRRGLGLVPLKVPVTPPAETKGYFLHDLYAKVGFTDVGRGALSVLGRQRRARVQIGGLIFGVASAAVILGLSIAGTINNRALVEQAVTRAEAAKGQDSDQPAEALAGLNALAGVGDAITQLENLSANTPLGYGAGFFVGPTLLPPLARLYSAQLKRVFVDPTALELEATLTDMVASGGAQNVVADYDLLKVYLMLTTHRQHLDVAFATPVLLEQWKKQLNPEVAKEQAVLSKLIARYLGLVQSGAARWANPDEGIIESARRSLKERDAEYHRLVAEAAAGAQPVTLRELLGGRAHGALSANYAVPGLYSRAGWRLVRGKLGDTPEGVDAWVLGEYDDDQKLAAHFRELYLEKFADQWFRFLRELRVNDAENLIEARRVLEGLTERPYAYEVLIRAIQQQFEFPTAASEGAGFAEKMLVGKAKQVATALGDNKPELPKNKAQLAFQPIFELIDPPPDPSGQVPVSLLSEYHNQLSAVRAEMSKFESDQEADLKQLKPVVDDARRVTDAVLQPLNDKIRVLMEPLLFGPLRGAVDKAELERVQRMTSSFAASVCDVYYENLAGRYPFTRGATEDALLDAVIAFFGPTGTAWVFYDTYLKNDLVRRGDVYEVKGVRPIPAEVVEFYTRAWQVRTALFPNDQERLGREVQIMPLPVTLTGKATVVSGVSLTSGEDKKTYRFGPPETWTFLWPAKSGLAGLALEGRGDLPLPLEATGDWALYRLFDRAKATPGTGGWFEARFKFKQLQLEVPFKVRTTGRLSPFFERSGFELSCKRSS